MFLKRRYVTNDVYGLEGNNISRERNYMQRVKQESNRVSFD